MDRRFLTVLGMSVVLALVVAGLFYQITKKAQAKPPAVMRDLVVAAEPLQLGVQIKPPQVKVVKVPDNMFPKTGFSNPNDVLVTGRPPNADTDTVTTTVLQNITVLSANQQTQPDSRGNAINATVVSLLVTPEQAEVLTLAGNEGKIQLVLRNAIDQEIQTPPGKQVAELYGMRKRAIVSSGGAPAPRRPKVEELPPPPPPPAPVVVPDEIIMIRGNQKSVEVVGTRQSQ